MTLPRALELMDIEMKCILRNYHKECNRDCKNCYLVQKDTDLIEAYIVTKWCINEVIKEKRQDV